MESTRKLTELELINAHIENTCIVQNLFACKQLSLTDIDDFVPGHLHINDKHSLAITYLSKSAAEYLGASPETVIEMKERFLTTYIHPQSRTIEHPKVKSFFSSSQTTPYHYFEMVKCGGKRGAYRWFLSACKESPQINGIIYNSIPIKEIQKFVIDFFNKVGEFKDLRDANRNLKGLTPQELRIIALIGKGARRHEIAEELNISKTTLDTHRKNIRSKLNARTMTEAIARVQRTVLKI